MNRRQLLQSMGLLSAHAMFPAVLSSFIVSCTTQEKKDYAPVFFTADEMDTVIDAIDIVIPVTKTQSASQANTHQFLDQVFSVCMTAEQQKVIKDGVAQLRVELASSSDKLKFLSELDQKAFADDDAAAYFKTIKHYTLIGFFTSQEGTTKASNYVKIPEAYHGEIPLTEGTLNYGKTSLQF